MSSKTARAVRAIREKVENSGSELDSIGSDEDMDRRRVCVATTSEQKKSRTRITEPDRRMLVKRMDAIVVDDRRWVPIVDLPDAMIEGAGRD